VILTHFLTATIRAYIWSKTITLPPLRCRITSELRVNADDNWHCSTK